MEFPPMLCLLSAVIVSASSAKAPAVIVDRSQPGLYLAWPKGGEMGHVPLPDDVKEGFLGALVLVSEVGFDRVKKYWPELADAQFGLAIDPDSDTPLRFSYE